MEQPTRRSTENWRKGVADMEEQGKIKGRNFGRQQTFTQRTGLTQMFRSKKDRTSHMHVVKAFEDGGRFNLFKVHGSAIFSRNVMVRSVVCAILGEGYYIANQMRPDRGVDGFTDFYWAVIGNCLSLLLVFKSNVSYIRFWEARTHVGSLLNHLRSFTRRLLFSSDLRAGDAQVEAAIENMFRWQRAFFILLMQDVRLTQDLGRISDDVITNDEKEFLLSARRRPLTVLGWLQAGVSDLHHQGHISERLQMALEEVTGRAILAQFCAIIPRRLLRYSTSRRSRRRTTAAPRSDRSRCRSRTRSSSRSSPPRTA